MSMHEAHFSGTRLYAGEAQRDGTYVHVLAYENEAESLHPGPNAMIFPLPAKSLGPENVIDTRNFKTFVQDIEKATKRPSDRRSFGLMKGAAAAGLADSFQMFDVGSYTVVISKSIVGLAVAFSKLPENKRPEINREVLASIRDLYPDQPIVAACWSGSIKPEPLLFWYEPINPSVLFAPALDSHDGRPPQPKYVQVDHRVAFGSTIAPKGPREVRYKEGDAIPADVRSILPTHAVGIRCTGLMKNGDFFFDVKGFKNLSTDVSAYRAFPSGTQNISIAIEETEAD